MTLEIIYEQIASKYNAETVQLLSQLTTLKQLDAALANSFPYITAQLSFIKQNNYVFIAEHNYMTINNQQIMIEDLENFINNKINSQKRNIVTDYLEKAIAVLEEYKENQQLIANVINWFDNFLHETDVHFTQTSDTHEMFVDMFLSQLNSSKPENYINLNQELVVKLGTLWDEIFNLVHALDDQPSYVFESYSQEDIYIVYKSTVNDNHFIKLKGTYSSYEGELLTRVLMTSPKTKTVIYY